MEEEKNYWEKVPYSIHLELCRRFRHPEDVEDIEQDILYHVWRSRFNFRGKCSFNTWAYRIAKNRIVQFYRDEIKREQKEMDYAYIFMEQEKIDAESQNIFSQVCANMIIESIPVNSRKILLMRLSDFSFTEIARDMNITYEAARSRYRRMIARLSIRYNEL